jgi:hypothetical protein
VGQVGEQSFDLIAWQCRRSLFNSTNASVLIGRISEADSTVVLLHRGRHMHLLKLALRIHGNEHRFSLKPAQSTVPGASGTYARQSCSPLYVGMATGK